ncbi:MAG: hypothetical protein JRK26_18155 [Deltaproteobacteria bacterium]|nr:hypothetical protein [Deltaproteobacteria bacterium]MBW1995992.1 hypothetical protein [Deltaproteobacteria bacterium]
MNQEIFNIGLSTEAISVYLLCCSLEDEGKAVSMENLMDIWNSTKQALIQSLDDLEQRNILRKTISDMADNIVYQLTDVHTWDMKRR